MVTGESNATGGQRLTESPGGEDAHETDANVDATERIDDDCAEAQALWRAAYAYASKNEGGWSNHPNDRGGATMGGVTQTTYDRWRRKQGLPLRSVRLIEPQEHEAIFREEYWEEPGFDQIRPERVAIKVFDFGLPASPRRSAVRLQRALNQLGAYPMLMVDGKVGPKTLAACREMACRHGEDAVLAKLVEIQAAYFDAIDDGSHAVFAKGWQNRAKRLPDVQTA